MSTWKILMIMSLLGLVACAYHTPPTVVSMTTYNPYPVVLQPDPPNNRLLVISPPQGVDASGKKNGWIGFDYGESGKITLKLNTLNNNPACTDNEVTSAEWVITKVELSNNGKKSTQKGRDFGSKQPDWLTRSFPDASPNGVLFDKPKADGVLSFEFGNENNNNKNQPAAWAYYQVTATKCLGSNVDGSDITLQIDPGVGNRGK